MLVKYLLLRILSFVIKLSYKYLIRFIVFSSFINYYCIDRLFRIIINKCLNRFIGCSFIYSYVIYGIMFMNRYGIIEYWFIRVIIYRLIKCIDYWILFGIIIIKFIRVIIYSFINKYYLMFYYYCIEYFSVMCLYLWFSVKCYWIIIGYSFIFRVFNYYYPFYLLFRIMFYYWNNCYLLLLEYCLYRIISKVLILNYWIIGFMYLYLYLGLLINSIIVSMSLFSINRYIFSIYIISINRIIYYSLNLVFSYSIINIVLIRFNSSSSNSCIDIYSLIIGINRLLLYCYMFSFNISIVSIIDYSYYLYLSYCYYGIFRLIVYDYYRLNSVNSIYRLLVYDYYSLLLLLLSRLISSISSYYSIGYYGILILSSYYWLWFIGFIRIKFLLGISIYYWINWYIVISLLSIYLTFIGFIRNILFRFYTYLFIIRFILLIIVSSFPGRASLPSRFSINRFNYYYYYELIYLVNIIYFSFIYMFKYWVIRYKWLIRFKCYIYKYLFKFTFIYLFIVMFYNYGLLVLLLLLAFSSSNNSFIIISYYRLISILALLFSTSSINYYSLTFSAFNIYIYGYSSLLFYRVINRLFIYILAFSIMAISSSSNSLIMAFSTSLFSYIIAFINISIVRLFRVISIIVYSLLSCIRINMLSYYNLVVSIRNISSIWLLGNMFMLCYKLLVVINILLVVVYSSSLDLCFGFMSMYYVSSLVVINLGPQHPSTHGVLRLLCFMNNDIISWIEVELGLLHRGSEKLIGNNSIIGVIGYFDRLDYVSTVSQELLYIHYLELIFGIKISIYDSIIRVIFLELYRIMNHLLCITTSGIDLGIFSTMLIGFEQREKLINLQESLTGNRLHSVLLFIGKLRYDISIKWIESIINVVISVFSSVIEFGVILSKSSIWINRLYEIGIISKNIVLYYGISGIISRASNLILDGRIMNYECYGLINYSIYCGNNSDCLDRYLLRFNEIIESCSIIINCSLVLLSINSSYSIGLIDSNCLSIGFYRLLFIYCRLLLSIYFRLIVFSIYSYIYCLFFSFSYIGLLINIRVLFSNCLFCLDCFRLIIVYRVLLSINSISSFGLIGSNRMFSILVYNIGLMYSIEYLLLSRLFSFVIGVLINSFIVYRLFNRLLSTLFSLFSFYRIIIGINVYGILLICYGIFNIRLIVIFSYLVIFIYSSIVSAFGSLRSLIVINIVNIVLIVIIIVNIVYLVINSIDRYCYIAFNSLVSIIFYSLVLSYSLMFSYILLVHCLIIVSLVAAATVLIYSLIVSIGNIESLVIESLIYSSYNCIESLIGNIVTFSYYSIVLLISNIVIGSLINIVSYYYSSIISIGLLIAFSSLGNSSFSYLVSTLLIVSYCYSIIVSLDLLVEFSLISYYRLIFNYGYIQLLGLISIFRILVFSYYLVLGLISIFRINIIGLIDIFSFIDRLLIFSFISYDILLEYCFYEWIFSYCYGIILWYSFYDRLFGLISIFRVFSLISIFIVIGYCLSNIIRINYYSYIFRLRFMNIYWIYYHYWINIFRFMSLINIYRFMLLYFINGYIYYWIKYLKVVLLIIKLLSFIKYKLLLLIKIYWYIKIYMFSIIIRIISYRIIKLLLFRINIGIMDYWINIVLFSIIRFNSSSSNSYNYNSYSLFSTLGNLVFSIIAISIVSQLVFIAFSVIGFIAFINIVSIIVIYVSIVIVIIIIWLIDSIFGSIVIYDIIGSICIVNMIFIYGSIVLIFIGLLLERLLVNSIFRLIGSRLILFGIGIWISIGISIWLVLGITPHITLDWSWFMWRLFMVHVIIVLQVINLGPQHPSTHGVLRISTIFNRIISWIEVELGYLVLSIWLWFNVVVLCIYELGYLLLIVYCIGLCSYLYCIDSIYGVLWFMDRLLLMIKYYGLSVYSCLCIIDSWLSISIYYCSNSSIYCYNLMYCCGIYLWISFSIYCCMVYGSINCSSIYYYSFMYCYWYLFIWFNLILLFIKLLNEILLVNIVNCSIVVIISSIVNISSIVGSIVSAFGSMSIFSLIVHLLIALLFLSLSLVVVISSIIAFNILSSTLSYYRLFSSYWLIFSSSIIIIDRLMFSIILGSITSIIISRGTITAFTIVLTISGWSNIGSICVAYSISGISIEVELGLWIMVVYSILFINIYLVISSSNYYWLSFIYCLSYFISYWLSFIYCLTFYPYLLLLTSISLSRLMSLYYSIISIVSLYRILSFNISINSYLFIYSSSISIFGIGGIMTAAIIVLMTNGWFSRDNSCVAYNIIIRVSEKLLCYDIWFRSIYLVISFNIYCLSSSIYYWYSFKYCLTFYYLWLTLYIYFYLMVGLLINYGIFINGNVSAFGSLVHSYRIFIFSINSCINYCSFINSISSNSLLFGIIHPYFISSSIRIIIGNSIIWFMVYSIWFSNMYLVISSSIYECWYINYGLTHYIYLLGTSIYEWLLSGISFSPLSCVIGCLLMFIISIYYIIVHIVQLVSLVYLVSFINYSINYYSIIRLLGIIHPYFISSSIISLHPYLISIWYISIMYMYYYCYVLSIINSFSFYNCIYYYYLLSFIINTLWILINILSFIIGYCFMLLNSLSFIVNSLWILVINTFIYYLWLLDGLLFISLTLLYLFISSYIISINSSSSNSSIKFIKYHYIIVSSISINSYRNISMISILVLSIISSSLYYCIHPLLLYSSIIGSLSINCSYSSFSYSSYGLLFSYWYNYRYKYLLSIINYRLTSNIFSFNGYVLCYSIMNYDLSIYYRLTSNGLFRINWYLFIMYYISYLILLGLFSILRFNSYRLMYRFINMSLINYYSYGLFNISLIDSIGLFSYLRYYRYYLNINYFSLFINYRVINYYYVLIRFNSSSSNSYSFRYYSLIMYSFMNIIGSYFIDYLCSYIYWFIIMIKYYSLMYRYYSCNYLLRFSFIRFSYIYLLVFNFIYRFMNINGYSSFIKYCMDYCYYVIRCIYLLSYRLMFNYYRYINFIDFRNIIIRNIKYLFKLNQYYCYKLYYWCIDRYCDIEYYIIEYFINYIIRFINWLLNKILFIIDFLLDWLIDIIKVLLSILLFIFTFSLRLLRIIMAFIYWLLVELYDWLIRNKYVRYYILLIMYWINRFRNYYIIKCIEYYIVKIYKYIVKIIDEIIRWIFRNINCYSLSSDRLLWFSSIIDCLSRLIVRVFISSYLCIRVFNSIISSRVFDSLLCSIRYILFSSLIGLCNSIIIFSSYLCINIVIFILFIYSSRVSAFGSICNLVLSIIISNMYSYLFSSIGINLVCLVYSIIRSISINLVIIIYSIFNLSIIICSSISICISLVISISILSLFIGCSICISIGICLIIVFSLIIAFIVFSIYYCIFSYSSIVYSNSIVSSRVSAFGSIGSLLFNLVSLILLFSLLVIDSLIWFSIVIGIIVTCSYLGLLFMFKYIGISNMVYSNYSRISSVFIYCSNSYNGFIGISYYYRFIVFSCISINMCIIGSNNYRYISNSCYLSINELLLRFKCINGLLGTSIYWYKYINWISLVIFSFSINRYIFICWSYWYIKYLRIIGNSFIRINYWNINIIRIRYLVFLSINRYIVIYRLWYNIILSINMYRLLIIDYGLIIKYWYYCFIDYSSYYRFNSSSSNSSIRYINSFRIIRINSIRFIRMIFIKYLIIIRLFRFIRSINWNYRFIIIIRYIRISYLINYLWYYGIVSLIGIRMCIVSYCSYLLSSRIWLLVNSFMIWYYGIRLIIGNSISYGIWLISSGSICVIVGISIIIGISIIVGSIIVYSIFSRSIRSIRSIISIIIRSIRSIIGCYCISGISLISVLGCIIGCIIGCISVIGCISLSITSIRNIIIVSSSIRSSIRPIFRLNFTNSIMTDGSVSAVARDTFSMEYLIYSNNCLFNSIRFNNMSIIIESSKGIYCLCNSSIISNDFIVVSNLISYCRNINLGDIIAVLGSIDFVMGSVDCWWWSFAPLLFRWIRYYY